jgi:hypothetical protein
MGSNEQGLRMMDQYQLDDCPIISDPECRIFRAYQLPRGNWRQLFGLRIWIEGFKAAILKGYGFGKLMGDGFQMSGAFVVRDGRIVAAYPSKDAADSCSWKPALQAMVLMSLLLVDWASQPVFAQATGPVPGPVPDLKLSVSNPQGVQAMAKSQRSNRGIASNLQPSTKTLKSGSSTSIANVESAVSPCVDDPQNGQRTSEFESIPRDSSRSDW